MKQTAVDWLHEEYKKILKDNDISALQAFEITDKYTQAKEMEKYNILKTWYDCKWSIIIEKPIDAEQYYKETYEQ